MRHFLSIDCCLKHLEEPCVYNTNTDELYGLDKEAFGFLIKCAAADGFDSKSNTFVRFCQKEGILDKTPQSRTHPMLKKQRFPSLRYLELQITTKCNLKCRHCFLGGASKGELEIASITKVLDEFQAMQGLRVLVTGGEPFLHSSFDEFNSLIKSYSIRKVLFTNGQIINKKRINALNFNEVQVSLDGIGKSHDALRGAGTYEKALKFIRYTHDRGISVSVATMAHKRNLGDFGKMEAMLTKLGIKDWTVDIPCDAGFMKLNPQMLPTPEEAASALGYGFGDGLHGGGAGYACGLHLMSVNADGSCSKCSFYSDKPAGFIPDGLSKCWRRIKPVRLDRLQCDCTYLDACRGGCRYRAEAFGSKLGKDLYRCAYYAKIKSTRRKSRKEVHS